MKKVAYKKEFKFGDPNKYRIFLKQQLLKLKPDFRAVIAAKKIETVDGPMFVIEFTKDIENPETEPIVEVTINGEILYWWRDHCWAIAVDKSSKQLIKVFNDRKIVIIHRVGTDTI